MLSISLRPLPFVLPQSFSGLPPINLTACVLARTHAAKFRPHPRRAGARTYFWKSRMPFQRDKSSFETYREGGTTSSISALIKMVLIVRQFRNRLDGKLRTINQTCSRMETLSAILNIQGPKSQSDIAKRLRVEAATVTRMVDILSKEGLVERSPDPNDRRVNLLSISPKGEIVLEQIFEIYDELRHHMLEGLAPEDVDTMHRLFDHMTSRLEHPVENKLRIGRPSYERREGAEDRLDRA